MGDYHTKLGALIPYLAGLSGNLLKYASIANDLAQNDKVVKSYIEVLEWMFIVKRIYSYVKNRAKRQTIEMPKLHLIEVKASSTIREQDFKGLHNHGELVGEQFKYGIIFYTGSRFLPFR